MSSTELKDKIFDKLQNADDNVLRSVLSMLEFESNTGVYELSEAEKKSIQIGLAQIENGETISNEEVEKEINEWLKK